MTRRHLDHVELWSTWPFQAGASRLALLTGIVSMRDTWRIGGEGRTTLRLMRGDATAAEGTMLRSAAEAYALAVPGRVVVFVFDDYSRLVRRIVDRTDATDDQGVATLELLGLSVSLAKTPPVQLGDLFRFDGVGLTAAQHLSAYILPAATAGGLTFVAAGEIIPTGIRDITYDGDTAWSALQKVEEAFDAELSLRWDHSNAQVLIDLLPSDGSIRIDESYDRESDGRLTVTDGALVTSSTFGDHLVDPVGVRLEVGHNAAITRVLSEKERATRVVGLFGDGSTIAEALWVITDIDGTDITLADLGGGPGPILVDDQLNDLYLEAPDRVTRVKITDSVAATQTVTVTSASALSEGDRVRIRADAAGGKLVSLTDPAELASGGDIVRVIRREDIAATVNLVENADQSIWTGGTSSPADGWSAVGSPTIARNSTAAHIETGSYSCRVDATADADGLATPLTPVSPGAAYLSGFVSFKLVSGAVRVEMVATDGVDSWVFPDGVSQSAVTTLTGRFVKAGVAGIDLSALGITAVRMRLVQEGDVAASFYVDAAQVTESAGQQPLVIGAGPTQGWQAVNAELAVAAPIRAQYTGNVLDFHRLDPDRYPDQELVPGALHTIVDPGRGIVDGVRLLEVTRSGAAQLDTTITLSNLASDLRSLRGRLQPRRLTTVGSGARITPAAAGARTIHVTMTASSAAVSSSDAAFTEEDEGLVLWVIGAGASGAILKTTLSAVTDEDTATAAGDADTTVTDAVAFLGTSEGVLTLAAGQGASGVATTIDAAARDDALTQASIRELARRIRVIEETLDIPEPSETGPNLDVVATPGATTYSVAWVGDGVELSIDGGSYGTPPASPISVARNSAGGAWKEYRFRGTKNDQTVTDGVSIPPLDLDTVTPDLTVIPATPGATSQQFTVQASNPAAVSHTITINVTIRGSTGSIPGQAISNGGTIAVSSNTVVTVNRPPVGTAPATVEFRATVSNGGREVIQRTVVPRGFGPTLTVTPTELETSVSIDWDATGSVDYRVDSGAWTTPPAAPVTVARAAAGGDAKTVQVRATLDGQSISCPVIVRPQEGSGGGDGGALAVSSFYWDGSQNNSANTIPVSWAITGDGADSCTVDITYQHDGSWYSGPVTRTNLGDAVDSTNLDLGDIDLVTKGTSGYQTITLSMTLKVKISGVVRATAKETAILWAKQGVA